MAYSTQEAVSDGTLVLLSISIKYLDRDEISVYYDGILNTMNWTWVGTTDTQIQFSPAVPIGMVVTVKRVTDISDVLHDFTGGAAFTASSLDENYQQILHIAQEVAEGSLGSDFFKDIDMHGHGIFNLEDALMQQSPVTLKQLQAGSMGGAYSAEVVATAGQVSIITAVQYTPGIGAVQIFINGVFQNTSAYTETNQNTITFSEGLSAGDVVHIRIAGA